MCALFIFPIPAVGLYVKDLGFIPTCLVAFFIVMLGQFGSFQMTLFQILPVFLELYS
jgi:hypothetical protein